ncbi:MAG TPA: PilZ domain-containing protein [Gemmataceae bacterium]|nr:PilZ domain-containing protein [Gemmataceae bacterium]
MFVQSLEALPVTFAERRRAARRLPAHGTVCRLTDADGDELGCGLVWNLSATGVSMLLPLRLEPGTRLAAELVNGAGDTVSVGLTVVHLSPMRTGDFILGGQFGRTLDEAEMRPFVL